jgi:tetratricopeptide (TPR) repeat protein
MDSKSSPDRRITELNKRVAALQREGRIKEGVALADEAFFTALEDLPEGHFLRAQSARNRGIMQFMAGNAEEALKTIVVAISFYEQTHEALRKRREELEGAGQIQEALSVAQEQATVVATLEQLRETVTGDRGKGQ